MGRARKPQPNAKRRRKRGEALAEALAFVGRWRRTQGPSVSDLAAALDVSPQRAGQIARELVARGQLTVTPGRKWGDPSVLSLAREVSGIGETRTRTAKADATAAGNGRRAKLRKAVDAAPSAVLKDLDDCFEAVGGKGKRKGAKRQK